MIPESANSHFLKEHFNLADKVKMFSVDRVIFLPRNTNRYTSDYEKLKRLGYGTFGQVYKCKHKKSNIISAVKHLKEDVY